jgi:hypothetical protein
MAMNDPALGNAGDMQNTCAEIREQMPFENPGVLSTAASGVLKRRRWSQANTRFPTGLSTACSKPVRSSRHAFDSSGPVMNGM